MNRAKLPNRIFNLIVPLTVALIIAVLVTPTIVERLNLARPEWLPQWAAATEVKPEAQEISTEDATVEAWPTVPGGILAASGNVTPIAPRATGIPAVTRTPFPTPTLRLLPTPSWRSMNTLTSIKFNASTIVDAKRNTSLSVLGDITTDTLLLKAVGDVSVGIDLSRVSNVQIVGDTIRLKLPAPEVMAVELLPDKSEVYARASTLFLSQYEGFETEALELARRQLRKEIASNQGLMDLTGKMVRLQLTEFLETVGYKEITFETQLNASTNGADATAQ